MKGFIIDAAGGAFVLWVFLAVLTGRPWWPVVIVDMDSSLFGLLMILWGLSTNLFGAVRLIWTK